MSSDHPDNNNPLRISAVVCTCNEATFLREALMSLSWADETIVFDMRSTDGSREIAKECGCTVIDIMPVDFIEQARAMAVSYCKNDWVCFSDPDFIFPAEHLKEIVSRINTPGTTCLSMRYVNYYCGKPVRHGKWGPYNDYPIIFNRAAMELPAILHNGFRLKQGETNRLPEHIFLKHMWIQNQRHFYQKHLRYLLHEGERRIIGKQKPSRMRVMKIAFKAVRRFATGGFFDGLMGVDLFWKALWYELEAEKMLALGIRTHQKTIIESGRTSHSPIHVYFNYYPDPSLTREFEINYCLLRLTANPLIATVHVISETKPPINSEKIGFIKGSRPSYAEIFSHISETSKPDAINVIINSDCFFDDADTVALFDLKPEEAYCLGRYEIQRMSSWEPNRRLEINPKHKTDMQDCWVFRGKPRTGMHLDFLMGKPGCDNRLAYELQQAGYRILNPRSKIRLYHFHTSCVRRYEPVERVPGPYAFPEQV